MLRPLTIQVGEDVRPTSENGEALVIGEFLEAQPDSPFRVLLPVAESLRRGGMDVTLHHPTNLGKLLSQALDKLAALPATAPAASPVLSRVEVLAGRGGVLPFPVQTAAASAIGVYRSFDNFRANRLYLFRRADNAATESLLVLLNGRKVARLLPKQYVRLPAPDQHTELVLCLQRPTAPTATPASAQLIYDQIFMSVAPDHDGAVYIECVALPAVMQPPVLRIVPARTGTAQVNQMRRAE